MSVEVISTYTEGDTRPVLSRNYGSGSINITGWTITLTIDRIGVPLLTKTASIDDGPAGDFSFTFGVDDLVAGEGQAAQIRFDDGAGGVFTQKDIQFNVAERLA